jgi:hypothetical protein
MQVLYIVFIVAIVVFSIPAFMYLSWFVHCAMDRICAYHAKRFCRKRGLQFSRLRMRIEFEPSGVKTEFTRVQVDCFDAQKQRKLVELLVWPLGVHKILSNENYPEAYDEQWPKTHT